MIGTTTTQTLGSKVRSLLRENAWVRRASDRVVNALLTLVDSAEEVGPRKAMTNTVRDTVKKTARNTVRKVSPGKKKAAAQTGAVRARSTSSAQERRVPKEIRTTGGHGLSGEVVERAVKRPNTTDFKVKKGKRT